MARDVLYQQIRRMLRQARIAHERGDYAAEIMLRARLQRAFSEYLNGAA